VVKEVALMVGIGVAVGLPLAIAAGYLPARRATHVDPCRHCGVSNAQVRCTTAQSALLLFVLLTSYL
jgi:hypothetical protein